MNDLVLQSPPAPEHLFLLFHGVGATPRDLVPLGQLLAARFPQAAVVSVAGPDASDLGGGRQWFSVRGVTEADRPARVAATLQRFLDSVRGWQERTGLTAEQTTLAGFSQGAIMSLEAALSPQPPAARVVSLSGRFAELPQAAPAGVRFHFLHGDQDPVIAVAHAQSGARKLQELGVQVSLDVLPGLGHGIDGAATDALLKRLSS